ncbi:MAG: hypothetical protein Q8Q20_02830 [bacterium]|nr:hypothetical protein [bacterium]
MSFKQKTFFIIGITLLVASGFAVFFLRGAGECQPSGVSSIYVGEGEIQVVVNEFLYYSMSPSGDTVRYANNEGEAVDDEGMLVGLADQPGRLKVMEWDGNRAKFELRREISETTCAFSVDASQIYTML